MGETRLQRLIGVRQQAVRGAVAAELRRVIEAEGISLRALGAAIGIDPSHLSRDLRGQVALSQDALVAIATGLGHDVSMRLFESVGPRVRDRIQVLMIEVLLAALDPRWLARLEVAVYRPVRGVIDLVLQERDTGQLVAGESHSLLASVEHQLRWAGQKADALASARGWPWGDWPTTPAIGHLLLLRSCAETHRLVATLPETFRAAYPGSTEAAVAALRSGRGAFPGAAIAWVQVDGAASRLLDGTPRGAR